MGTYMQLPIATPLQSMGTVKPTLTLVADLRSKMVACEHPTADEFRLAVERATRFLVASIVSGDWERIGRLSTALTQADAIYFHQTVAKEETSREWARALAVVGAIATTLYELRGSALRGS